MFKDFRTCTNCKFYSKHYCHLKDDEVCTDNPWDSCGFHATTREEMNVSALAFEEKILKVREETRLEWDDVDFPF